MKRILAIAPLVLAAASLSAPVYAASANPFPDPAIDVPADSVRGTQVAVFAGGCFWGVEGVYERVKGVKDAVSGFAGGVKETAHYETVSTGRTGHAESVKVVFDPTQITYGQLLKIFFSVVHDPTELNRQGPDEGTQYRSAIFYANDDQKKVAEAYIAQLDAAHVYKHKIVTEVSPLKGFYAAEGYHQHYLQNNPTNPYIFANDMPKLAALKKEYPELYKK
ncbi:MAG: peptide-methionine (S)-S-oxide reductase MsrA [Bryobacteraceae bacterium]